MKSRLLVAAFVAFLFGGIANADLVILNEYNAVSGSNFLGGDGTIDDSDAEDLTFGRIQGNGGNWIELLVIGDAGSSVVDMRGWSIDWEEDGDSGTITFSNDAVWSSLQRGTIITVTETNNGGFTGTDTSLDPTAGDWHINVATLDEVGVDGFISTTTTVAGDSDGNFSVGNDNFQLTILDDSGSTVHGAVGEGIGELSGVNSREIAKLEGPGAGATLADWLAIDETSSLYNDGTSSSWGLANVFNGGAESQDLSPLRTAVPEPTAVSLFALAGLAAFIKRRR